MGPGLASVSSSVTAEGTVGGAANKGNIGLTRGFFGCQSLFSIFRQRAR